MEAFLNVPLPGARAPLATRNDSSQPMDLTNIQ